MNKLFILTLLLFTISISSFANTNTSAVFESNESEIDAQLAALTSIEQYVAANPDKSLAELNVSLNITTNVLSSMRAQGDVPVLGIPSFLWGCVTGVVGVAIVHFIGEDKQETKKALWGCVANGAAWTILYFAVFATTAATTAAYY